MIKRERKTKIIATLGPSSSSLQMIESLFLKGVDVFRLNFSHGSHENHEENIKSLRLIEEKYQHPIAIMADLQGPKLRIGNITELPLKVRDTLRLSFLEDVDSIHLPHREIFDVVHVGMELLLDDGKIRLSVIHHDMASMTCDVKVGGFLSSKKGVNIPGVRLPLSAMTEKDKVDLSFILSKEIDWIALSFVQTAEDILEARHFIESIQPHHIPKMIAKLEKPLALEHLDSIVNVADAIMIARGDLGVELPPEDVPLQQKRIIRACRSVGKPVIVATQMMESMISSPTPTRAEASDVANAIYDHVDGVMLSAESASGQFPIEAVFMMDRIIRRTEQDIQSDYLIVRSSSYHTPSDAITAACREITQHLPIKAIVTLTEHGGTALSAAKERVNTPVFALTPNRNTARFLSLCWGVFPCVADHLCEAQKDFLMYVRTFLMKNAFVNEGDSIIITSGVTFEEGTTNRLMIVNV